MIRQGHGLFGARKGEGTATFRLEIGAVEIGGFQIQPLVRHQADHHIAGIDALAAEHAADADGTEELEKIIETARIAFHSCAGVICTDSPQPQAEV